MHDSDNYVFNSRVVNRSQEGITHKVVQNWFVRSSDKDGQSLNRNEVTTKPSVILVPEAHRETENGQNF